MIAPKLIPYHAQPNDATRRTKAAMPKVVSDILGAAALSAKLLPAPQGDSQ